MNRQDQRDLYEELTKQLVDIEKQMEDKTLPHSDQQLMDQAWDEITRQIEELDQLFEMQDDEDIINENEQVDNRDGCMYCPGCMYCEDSRFNLADEV